MKKSIYILAICIVCLIAIIIYCSVKSNDKETMEEHFVSVSECADCGCSMYREKSPNYYCGNYRNKKGCTKHYINELELD